MTEALPALGVIGGQKYGPVGVKTYFINACTNKLWSVSSILIFVCYYYKGYFSTMNYIEILFIIHDFHFKPS